MPVSFTRAEVTPSSANTRALLYTAPSGSTSIVFSGTVSNIDSTLKTDHMVTVEIKKTDLSYKSILKEVPIAYGGSLPLPKTILTAGEALWVTSVDDASCLTAIVAVALKS